jgi:hypothetical protein
MVPQQEYASAALQELHQLSRQNTQPYHDLQHQGACTRRMRYAKRRTLHTEQREAINRMPNITSRQAVRQAFEI